MSSKPTAVLEATREARTSRHTSNVSMFEPSIRGSHSSGEREHAAPLDLTGYRIAFLSGSAGDGASPRTDDKPSQLLLVPLTWNQLLSQFHREMTHSTTQEDGVVRFSQIRVDLPAMEVRRMGQVVRMTAMEFKILKFFLANPNRVISRDELLNQVWGYDNYPCTRTVDNHVLRLRQKLETSVARPVHFQTVHGIGYKFTPFPATSPAAT